MRPEGRLALGAPGVGLPRCCQPRLRCPREDAAGVVRHGAQADRQGHGPDSGQAANVGRVHDGCIGLSQGDLGSHPSGVGLTGHDPGLDPAVPRRAPRRGSGSEELVGVPSDRHRVYTEHDSLGLGEPVESEPVRCRVSHREDEGVPCEGSCGRREALGSERVEDSGIGTRDDVCIESVAHLGGQRVAAREDELDAGVVVRSRERGGQCLEGVLETARRENTEGPGGGTRRRAADRECGKDDGSPHAAPTRRIRPVSVVSCLPMARIPRTALASCSRARRRATPRCVRSGRGVGGQRVSDPSSSDAAESHRRSGRESLGRAIEAVSQQREQGHHGDRQRCREAKGDGRGRNRAVGLGGGQRRAGDADPGRELRLGQPEAVPVRANVGSRGSHDAGRNADVTTRHFSMTDARPGSKR